MLEVLRVRASLPSCEENSESARLCARSLLPVGPGPLSRVYPALPGLPPRPHPSL